MDEPQIPITPPPAAEPVMSSAFARYYGEDRRSPLPGVYDGIERRTPDPATEQDHPELF